MRERRTAAGLLILALTFTACSPQTPDAPAPAEELPAGAGTPPSAPRGLNILFIGIDDMATTTGFYDYEGAITPHFDRLASDSIVFDRAYVQMAKCTASRASLLTGCRPETTGVFHGSYSDYFLNTFLQEHATLPEFFEQHGYRTRTFGKVHHGYTDELDTPHFMKYPRAPYYARPENRDIVRNAGSHGNLPLFEFAEAEESAYPDAQIADAAIEALRSAAKSDTAFFFAVGFSQPHLPWVTPKAYRDRYDGPDAPRARRTPPADNAPAYAIMQSGLRRFDFPESFQELSESERADEMTRAYLAAVSFVDAQVGKLIDELERLEIRDNTVIMLWSDHGFHLGTHGMWGKRTNYEEATRSPLLLSIPGMKTAGRRTRALVEFVDLFPTLADIAGLPIPEHIEGTSFLPLIHAPDQPWKTGAFSLVHRNDPGGSGVAYRGYALRTERYRYVEWWEMRKNRKIRRDARELYDLTRDPSETVNIVYTSESAALVIALADQLWAGYDAATPNLATDRSHNRGAAE